MNAPCSTGDRQDKSSAVLQRQFPMLGEPRRPAMADPCCVSKCEDLLDAVRLCVHSSNFSHSHIAESLGIDAGHWTRIMQGRAHFPTRRMRALMELCGNLAPLQFLAQSMGYALKDASTERIEQLERELQQARRAA